ncbi:MAG TPA: patatin family protein [Ruminococcus sp.]|nr:patatin family protein [Ruminococcus sp.]
MKYGIVLEGGAMRGLFTAGATDVLMEEGITFDGGVGVSAGAAFGCNIKSEQPGRAVRYNLRFCNDKRYCSKRSLIKTGDLFNADFCYHTVPEKLDLFDFRAYEESPMEFYIVCTDVVSGKPVYHRSTRMDASGLEWLRASASLPLVSRIVEADGRKLLDGGITDSIPLRFMESVGYEKNIVILTQPRDYRKEKTGSLPLVKISMRKYPELIKAVAHRHEMYNAELDYVRKAESEGRAYVIAPERKLPVKRVEHDQDKLLEAYRMGRTAVKNHLSEIKTFLGIE